jgi:uncharacterized Ntn-hydrolase superfamily protein
MPTIVGRDAENDDLGVAMETKTLAVGADGPWARAGVGALAITGIEDPVYGRAGLDLLASGKSPEEVAALLTRADPRAGWRQIALVDTRGRSYTSTGWELAQAFSYRALHAPELAVVSAAEVGEGILKLMADTFQRTPGRLWTRLMTALHAGQHMVGDTRQPGQHSAALLVVRHGGGYGGYDDRLIDLRVDDHPKPVEKLDELLAIHAGQFLPPEPDDLVPVDASLAKAIQERLADLGDFHGWITGTYDVPTRTALERFAARETLEQLLRTDFTLDRRIIERLGLTEQWRLRAAHYRAVSPPARVPAESGPLDTRSP